MIDDQTKMTFISLQQTVWRGEGRNEDQWYLTNGCEVG